MKVSGGNLHYVLFFAKVIPLEAHVDIFEREQEAPLRSG